MSRPHYPQIRVATRSENPLTLVAAVRMALRRAAIDRGEIQRFSTEAMAIEDPRRRQEVCRRWVRVEGAG